LYTPTGTGSGSLLSTAGQDYFTVVLPNLATLAPTILISPSNAPFNQITTTVPSTVFYNTIASDFAGSALDPTTAASSLHIGAMWLGIILTLAVIAVVGIASTKYSNTYKGFIITCYPMIYVFTRIGWFPMLLAIGMGGLASAFLIFYVFFLEKWIT
jgi:hypothetical protein